MGRQRRISIFRLDESAVAQDIGSFYPWKTDSSPILGGRAISTMRSSAELSMGPPTIQRRAFSVPMTDSGAWNWPRRTPAKIQIA
jgi:hypothetical protein